MMSGVFARYLAGVSAIVLAIVGVNSCQSAQASLAPPDLNHAISKPVSSEPAFKDFSILAQDRRIPVIMWHNVVATEHDKRAWFDVSRERFKAQLDWLQREGWTPISLDAFYQHLTGGTAVPEKSIVLTFDDSYQGFYEHAYPVLKQRRIPAAMFVHTGFVGNTENSPKMGWEELEELVKDGLVTIGSHTVTHPEDLTRLFSEQVKRELEESKRTLEQKLNIQVRDFAYPVGKNNDFVRTMVMRAGYRMAFTTASGPAEESPGILAVNRWIETKLEEACYTSEAATANAPAEIAQVVLNDSPIEVRNEVINGRRLTMIVGGKPKTWLSAGRFPVGKIVSLAGAQAGINGGYFALSALQSDDTQMIGPCLTSNQKMFRPDKYEPRLPKLANRPVVVISPNRLAIYPFQPGTSNTEVQVRSFMPDVTDIFMAGAWFVHDGAGRSWDELKAYCAKDVNDHRRRAFFGAMADGRTVIGASISSVSTEQLGKALETAGVQEAVLLDSGYSTSLVIGDQILASGHSTPNKPSRPIPHSILIFSDLPQATQNKTVLSKIAAERRTASQGGFRQK